MTDKKRICDNCRDFYGYDKNGNLITDSGYYGDGYGRCENNDEETKREWTCGDWRDMMSKEHFKLEAERMFLAYLRDEPDILQTIVRAGIMMWLPLDGFFNDTLNDTPYWIPRGYSGLNGVTE